MYSQEAVWHYFSTHKVSCQETNRSYIVAIEKYIISGLEKFIGENLQTAKQIHTKTGENTRVKPK